VQAFCHDEKLGYPARPGTILHRVSIIKDVGGWTVWSEEELKDKDFGVERR
jgi:hypothetical protein